MTGIRYCLKYLYNIVYDKCLHAVLAARGVFFFHLYFEFPSREKTRKSDNKTERIFFFIVSSFTIRTILLKQFFRFFFDFSGVLTIFPRPTKRTYYRFREGGTRFEFITRCDPIHASMIFFPQHTGYVTHRKFYGRQQRTIVLRAAVRREHAE